MKQFLVFFLLPCAIVLCAMDTPAAYSAFHGYSPATGEGGYTTSTAQREAISLRWTPTVDVGIRAVLPHCLALLAIGAALSLLAARSLRKL